MILIFTSALTFWLLAMIYLTLWYGILFAVGIAAIIIATILFLIAWLLTSAKGIFSERKREIHF